MGHYEMKAGVDGISVRITFAAGSDATGDDEGTGDFCSCGCTFPTYPERSREPSRQYAYQ